MYSQPHAANGPTMTRTLSRAPILGLPTTMMRIEPVRAPQERLPMLGRRSSAQKKPQQHEQTTMQDSPQKRKAKNPHLAHVLNAYTQAVNSQQQYAFKHPEDPYPQHMGVLIAKWLNEQPLDDVPARDEPHTPTQRDFDCMPIDPEQMADLNSEHAEHYGPQAQTLGDAYNNFYYEATHQ